LPSNKNGIFCDTTSEMGDFYVKVVIFRHTEFEEAPVIPLIFMIHMKRIEFIHSFLFSWVAELVPEITGSKKVIIVSEGEKAITNAISKTWLNIPMFQCWIYAW
jgi:hypothetical protein